MQWLLLLLVLFIVFRYDKIVSFLQGVQKKEPPAVDKNKDDKGEYIDYEEIE